ncbi:MAG: asparagine synthase (glutamine-hydrolyzing) [Candidatus Krumholzibacteria bacterium]|nr:asparagine synthase (glutamine-hydrolyzing) [Candidatus Krumholzibacteria bacterium]
MCGLTGFWDQERNLDDATSSLTAMTAVLSHRGPDDQQIHYEPDTGLGLGHRRLSILDLSPEGRQPMSSVSGRFVMAFNGEIYNYRDLADELQQTGVVFRGHCDTEVILAAIEAWGLETTLARMNGMFAIVLWDRQDRKLHLVRDRLGIKPLFYGHVAGNFVFASEPAAFTALPGFTGEIDRGALTLYLRHLYVPAPWCIYQGIRKLDAGHVLTLSSGSAAELPASVPFWSVSGAVQEGLADPFTGTATAAVDQLEELLADAVNKRLVSDVPLGAFLSGGVDSSTVVGLMQKCATTPARTFSIGFTEEEFNEAAYAAEVAKHLGTDHTELIVSPQACLDVIPDLPGMYSEPFADSSQVPTFLVSRLARSKVTVSLSGDGGDELFCGYHRYNFARQLHRIEGRTPAWLRSSLAPVVRGIPVGVWDGLLKLVKPVQSDGRDFAVTGDRMHKLAGVLAQKDFAGMYRAYLSLWTDPQKLVRGGFEPPTNLTGRQGPPPVDSIEGQVMFWDMINALPDDLLTTVDRASMAVGLEARVPLLDHRVVEFAWRLPQEFKVRDGQSKWVLRQVLDRHVPRELIERPKRGFAVPLAEWLRGPLRPWGESLLESRHLEERGVLDARRVRRLWSQFQKGDRQWQSQLWAILMYQAWQQKWSVR